jgi:hypothetical protein
MEDKKITIRVPEALHLSAKRRMLDQFGNDNFQRLLLSALESFVEGDGSSLVEVEAAKSIGTAREQKQVSEFLDFLRTGEKSDVHTVLSLIARFSTRKADVDESLQERKLNNR